MIIDAVRAHPGDVTIVAVAMLTNLALAIRADPGIVPLVRGVIAMGGAFGTGRNFGNASPVAEANIFGDPEAADLRVCTTPWPSRCSASNVTERTIMTEDYLARIRDGGTPEGRFIWDVTRGYQTFHETRDRVHGIYAHDPSAAVCAVDDGAFVFRNGPVRVITNGIARGLTLQKPPGRQFSPNAWDDAPDQRVALGVRHRTRPRTLRETVPAVTAFSSRACRGTATIITIVAMVRQAHHDRGAVLRRGTAVQFDAVFTALQNVHVLLHEAVELRT